MPPLTFPQAARLKTPPQFDAVFGLKKSASDGVLVVFAGPNPAGRPRLGLSVSRKVGNAVARNRWKRLIREAFRLAQAELPACDYVVVPRRLPEPPSQEAVRASFVTLAKDAARRVAKASRERERPEDGCRPVANPTTSPPVAHAPGSPGPPVAHAPGSPEPPP